VRPEIVIFLGPSLDRKHAHEIIDATFLPPARRGDLSLAAEGGARIIGLIDGVFFQECAVGHREILDALRGGVRVIGASSMGALRAAELDVLGMEGVGEIYLAYKTGRIVSDDEVALVFDPDTYYALSEPLVNIRHAIDLAVDRKLIDHNTAQAILAGARSLYFPERTWEQIMSLVEEQIDNDELSRFLTFVRDEGGDLKREDAVRALVRITEIAKDLGIFL
jgi:hypothetical protein